MCSSAVLLLTLDQLLRGLEIKHGPLMWQLNWHIYKSVSNLCSRTTCGCSTFSEHMCLRVCFFTYVIMAVCSVRYIRRTPRARWFQRKHVLAHGFSWRVHTAAEILEGGATYISGVTGWHHVQSEHECYYPERQWGLMSSLWIFLCLYCLQTIPSVTSK